MENTIDNFDELSFDIDGLEAINETEVTTEVIDQSAEANTAEDTTTTTASEAKEDDNSFNVVFKTDSKEAKVNSSSDSDEDDDDVEVNSSSLVKQLVEAFAKDGVLAVDDEDIKAVKDFEGIKDLIAKTIKTNEYSDLSEEAKSALEAIRKGVPVDRVVQNYNTELTLSNIDEEDFVEAEDDEDEVADQKKDLRQKLIYQDLLSKGYSEAVARSKTEKSFRNNDDEEDAKIAATALLEKIKERKVADLVAAEDRAKDIEKQKEVFVESINNTKELVPGLPLTNDVKKWLVQSMTTPTGRTKDGKVRTVVSDKRAEDQTGFDTKLNYYIKLGLFDKKPNTSIFTSVKVSNATLELEKNLSQEGFYDGGKGISLKGLTGKREKINYNILDNFSI